MNQYQNPLGTRYASEEISYLFSPQFKHSTWRRLWVALAQEQKALGLTISTEQIEQMQSHVDTIDFDKAKSWEQKLRHDVMAHIHTFAEQCPLAKPIIHLGATSCYVTDNTELIQMKEGLKLLSQKLSGVITELAKFANTHKDLPCLAYTHYQPAQLTTVGKRACLWLQDLLIDLKELLFHVEHLPFLGVKGTTGTQASFLALFHGNHEKVIALDRAVAEKMGFERLLTISGQTYTRKIDQRVINALAGLATSAHKLATDIRLLAHHKEIEEPFETNQIGSSAMPYKRNPMRSERICALSRFLLSLAENPGYTAATQWFERTLDDSANRRLVISESFLTADSILNLLANLVNGLVVYPKRIASRVMEELPFMATENILMYCVQRGGDRQELHEKIRQHSIAAGRRIKEEGLDNDLLNRIVSDPSFGITMEEVETLMDVKQFVGCSPEQVSTFLREEIFSRLSNENQEAPPLTPITV